MKNLFKNLMLVAVAAMGFTACEQVNDDVNAGIDENTVTMTFVAEAPESRTSVSIDDDGDVAKYSWSTGDKVGFYYVDVEATDNKKKGSNAAAIAADGTATFKASFEEIKDASAYNIGAFYPSDSWDDHAESYPFNNVNVKIPAGQALTDGSFDRNADLMMSKPFMGVALSSDGVKTLEFTRIAAIGKMNLKLEGMEEGEIINKVRFSFAEGTHFNGPVFLDLENGDYTLATEGTLNYVELSGELAANADRTAIYFTCFPGEYSGEYTIVVTTDKATYSKTATLSKALSFSAGDVLNFNATVGNRYVEVVDDDVTIDTLDLNFTGVSENSTNYTSWSGTGASGAVYAGQSAGSYSSIQLRNSTPSGIVTTTSDGKVKKIVIDWNTNTKNTRTLTIYGKNTAYSTAADLYKDATKGTELGTIVMGTSTELEVVDDYAYIGFLANGAMYINEIKIYWESDGLTAQTLSFPQSAYTITEDDSFTAPTLTGAQTTVTYTSSDTAVATVDKDTGAVTIVGVGTTTITASAEATDAYRAAEASYTLTVNPAGGGDDEPVLVEKTATLSFANKAQRTTFTTSKQVWEQNGIKLTNDKTSDSSNVADYANPARFYKNSKLTLDAPGAIKSITFTCNGSSYATAMNNSIGTVAGVTVTKSGNNVTVTFTEATATQFVVAKLADQVRMNSLSVTYMGEEE